MIVDLDITNVVWTDGIYDKYLIDTGDREIPLNHFIDGEGDVEVTIHGTRLDGLCTEPRWRNTFQTITD